MFDFSRYKYISIAISVIAIVLGFAVTIFVHKGFAHSLDFNGGLRAVISLPKEKDRSVIQKFFEEQGIEVVTVLLDKERNNYQVDIGLDAIPKIAAFNVKSAAPTDKKPKNTIEEFIMMIKKGFMLESDRILSADQVGSVVGNELTSTGISLLVSTLLIMTFYLTLRFQFKYALGASLALMHDLLLTIAFMGAFQIKPSVPIIAALLTLLGYSINDTIVIFDRIRENTTNTKLKLSFSTVINNSINQTLGRTINTSLATLISIVAIIIGGAVELYDFSIVLIFGVTIGTYSSIFIAAPIVEIYDSYFPAKSS
ncbi:MAG TPA: protein translocase subunit SecF [Leptospiraceae bacterium]|nr:protein translocase subunit SecF [Leptospiraceae bacterium]HMY65160.1 protein translocase subunit SecF [Leptospiraceae bacterium]HNF12282.1 protein translocase subunit SecF [Leptospiraceae bacterium]HNF26344.1 protein translocase subunit SecF [Leptospiraceae bacterium]HNI94424.1 protein translocase subunit SecF [Leptospiraceae bacterium]